MGTQRTAVVVVLVIVGTALVMAPRRGSTRTVSFDWTLPERAGVGCHTALAGGREVPFPCGSRVARFNSKTFYDGWPDDATRDALFDRLRRWCVIGDRRPTAGLRAVGLRGDSGRWNRFWLVPVDAGGEPSCHIGVSAEVSMESPTAKVAVDRILYPEDGSGALEVQVYIRTRGQYTTCVYLLALMHADDAVQLGAQSEMGVLYTAQNFSRNSRLGRAGGDYSCNVSTMSIKCDAGDYNGGVDVRPLPQPCATSGDVDRFRFGGWRQVSRCDGVHCSGNVSWLGSGGWVWVSDICVVRMYSPSEAWKLMDRRWVVGWGVSTLKQPMANFLEYTLRSPLFGVFMEALGSYRGPRKPNFFSYRQWDTLAQDAADKHHARVSMRWGGCFQVTGRPDQCTQSMGVETWPKVRALIGPESLIRDPPLWQRHGIEHYPSVLLIDHDVWHWPIVNEVHRTQRIAAQMRWIEEWREAVASAKDHWNHTSTIVLHMHPAIHTNAMCWSFHGPDVEHYRHSFWIHEDLYAAHVAKESARAATMMKRRTPPHRAPLRWVLISRELITMPLRFGDTFVHVVVHYGASRGMCMTGSAKHYELQNCVRNTMGDDMLIMLWLNILHGDRPTVVR